MRVCLVCSQISKAGGISKYVTNLAEQFLPEHEVHVVGSRIDYEIEGADIHRTRILWSPVSAQVATAALANKIVSKRLLRDGTVDLVHSPGAETFGPTVLTSQSCHRAAVEQFRRERGQPYRFLKAFEPRSNIVFAIEKHNYAGGNCKKIISVSEGVKREIMHYYGTCEDDIVVIPNGVDLEKFNPEKAAIYRESIRKKWGFSDEDVVIVFTAWEFKRKGLRYIIEALQYLPSHVKILVLGSDDPSPYRDLGRRLGVGDQVVYAGHHPDTQRYYAASDLFVFPTSYEAFSLSSLEAVASGLPIIATEINGTEELVEDSVNGYFIERDGRDIAEKVKSAMDYGIDKMGAAARKTSLQYSWDRIAERTLKVYREVLE